eukprot:GFKZ01009145.1.p1 GENE.GFKZ01009145.1~~GFKZ01009145.1.p1  ORF type:complete len:282 (+),score=19.09 GFKZ01009145.1:267-1112(+)
MLRENIKNYRHPVHTLDGYINYFRCSASGNRPPAVTPCGRRRSRSAGAWTHPLYRGLDCHSPLHLQFAQRTTHTLKHIRPKSPHPAMSTPATITLLHGRTSHTLPIPNTLHQLQSDIEGLTKVPVSSQRLLLSGRKLSAPADTPLSTLGVSGGKKIMLLGQPSPSSKPAPSEAVVQPQTIPTSGNLEKVHACQKKVTLMEIRLQKVEKQVNGDGALKDRSRLKHETLVLSEEFMKVLLTLDSIVEEAEQGGVSGWKTERKALVRRVQADLERCDALGKEVQ